MSTKVVTQDPLLLRSDVEMPASAGMTTEDRHVHVWLENLNMMSQQVVHKARLLVSTTVCRLMPDKRFQPSKHFYLAVFGISDVLRSSNHEGCFLVPIKASSDCANHIFLACSRIGRIPLNCSKLMSPGDDFFMHGCFRCHMRITPT